MDLIFDIHDIVSVRLEKPPAAVKELLIEMLGYFECNDSGQATLNIKFYDQIYLPKHYVYLEHDLVYEEGCFYKITEDGIIFVPIKDLFSGKIDVKVQLTVSPVMILYLIEQIINIRALNMGYSMFHAAAVQDRKSINVYCGMRGAGKTKLTFMKLRQGANFLGDDKIFVNRDCEVLAYPRGITVHRYLGNDYETLISNPHLSKQIRKEIKYFNYLKILRAVFFPQKWIRKKIDRLIKGPGNIRANIKKIFPDVKILNSGTMGSLYFFFTAEDKQRFYRSNQFELKRAHRFILINNGMERDSAFLKPIFAFGDIYAIALEEKIKTLIYKERRIIVNVLKKLACNNNESANTKTV